MSENRGHWSSKRRSWVGGLLFRLTPSHSVLCFSSRRQSGTSKNMSRLTLMADPPPPQRMGDKDSDCFRFRALWWNMLKKRRKEGRVYFCSQFKGAAYCGTEVKVAGSVGPIAFAVRKKGAMNVLMAKFLCFSVVCGVGPKPKEWRHHF